MESIHQTTQEGMQVKLEHNQKPQKLQLTENKSNILHKLNDKIVVSS